jgi:hypothetical protein
MDLLVPVCNSPCAAILGLFDDVVEIATDRVHQNFAMKIESDIIGLAASTDLGNDWNGEAIVPRLVRVAQISEIVLHVCVCSCHSVEVQNLVLHMRFSLREGLEELRVAGRLVAAQAGLLIDNQTVALAFRICR